MAYKVLGQSNPSAGVATTVYTCAATKFVANVFVCNQSSTPAVVSVWTHLASGGQSVQSGQIASLNLDGNFFGLLSVGLTGINGTMVRIQSSTANTSISVFGDES